MARTERFLSRDAMHSADYAVARCLSVYLSVTRRYSIETAKHIIKFFHHRVIHHSSFFIPNGTAILQRGLPNDDIE